MNHIHPELLLGSAIGQRFPMNCIGLEICAAFGEWQYFDPVLILDGFAGRILG
jgi:hypothetical protein